MWDDVKPDCYFPLAARTISGNFAIFVNFMAVKFFPLTLVAMIINCAPLVQLILAGPLLKEKIKCSDIIRTFITFCGIGLVILGGKPQDKPAEYTPTMLAYAALLLNPFAISAGNLAMRAGRKLNDNVVSCYMALALFVVFLPICLATNADLSVWYSFSWFEWICLIGISGGTIISQTYRFKALKLYTVTGL